MTPALVNDISSTHIQAIFNTSESSKKPSHIQLTAVLIILLIESSALPHPCAAVLSLTACCPTAPCGNAKALHPHGTVKVITPEDAQSHRDHRLKLCELTPQTRQDTAYSNKSRCSTYSPHCTPHPTPHSDSANVYYSFIVFQF